MLKLIGGPKRTSHSQLTLSQWDDLFLIWPFLCYVTLFLYWLVYFIVFLKRPNNKSYFWMALTRTKLGGDNKVVVSLGHCYGLSTNLTLKLVWQSSEFWVYAVFNCLIWFRFLKLDKWRPVLKPHCNNFL